MSKQKRGQAVTCPPNAASAIHQQGDHDKSVRGLSTLGQAALGYARQGFAVLPCKPGEKGTLISKAKGGHGVYDATTNKQQIINWWSRYPNANIGLALPKGMVAIDVDPRNGGTNEGLPPTLVQKSGGDDGGEHWIYQGAPEELRGIERKGWNLKGNGNSYVLGAPSKTKNTYRWQDGFHPERIAQFPSDLDPILNTEGKRAANGEDRDPWTEYQLDWALQKLNADSYDDWIKVGMALRNVYGDEAFDRWVDWSRKSEKFKSEEDCWSHWRSFNRQDVGIGSLAFLLQAQGHAPIPPTDPRDDFGVIEKSPEASSQDILKFKKAANIDVEKKLWVWPDRIAERAVSLLAGEGGVGKGHITVEIVATITNGGSWPDDQFDVPCVGGEVLWFCAEDDPETELLPRLRAAEVNLDKVHLFSGKNVKNKHETTFSIEEDLVLLDRHLRELTTGIRLIVFDPITSYLHGKKGKAVDSHNATQLRSILQPLSEFSHRHDIAILGLTHFAKDSARRMIHRVVGSQVWTAVARSVLFAVKLEPEMRSELAQNQSKVEYVLLPGKGNNAIEGPAIRYQIGSVEFSTPTKKFPKGTLIETSKLFWTEVDRNLREEDLIGKSEKGPRAVKQANLERAVRRFFDEQKEEWLHSGQVIAYLKAEGFGLETTIKKDLAGVNYLDKKNEGFRWIWAIRKGKEES
jgi:hypothetical protein